MLRSIAPQARCVSKHPSFETRPLGAPQDEAGGASRAEQREHEAGEEAATALFLTRLGAGRFMFRFLPQRSGSDSTLPRVPRRECLPRTMAKKSLAVSTQERMSECIRVLRERGGENRGAGPTRARRRSRALPHRRNGETLHRVSSSRRMRRLRSRSSPARDR